VESTVISKIINMVSEISGIFVNSASEDVMTTPEAYALSL